MLLLAAFLWAPGGFSFGQNPPDFTGTWRFTDGGAALALQQSGSALTGAFQGDSGAKWDVKGSTTGTQITLVRYIPVAELVSNNLPQQLAQVALQQFPTDRPGFIRGDVTLRYDSVAGTLDGSYTTYSAVWTPSTGELDHFYTKDNELHLVRKGAIVTVPGYQGDP